MLDGGTYSQVSQVFSGSGGLKNQIPSYVGKTTFLLTPTNLLQPTYLLQLSDPIELYFKPHLISQAPYPYSVCGGERVENTCATTIVRQFPLV